MAIRTVGKAQRAIYRDAQGDRRARDFPTVEAATLFYDLNHNGGAMSPRMSTRAYVTLWRYAVATDRGLPDFARVNYGYWLGRCIAKAPVTPLIELRAEEVKSWRLAIAPPKSHTAYSCLAVLRQAFDFAVGEGLTLHNLIRFTDPDILVRPKLKPMTIPDGDERQLMADALAGDDRTCFLLTDRSAVRLSEAIALPKSSYAVEERRLTIDRRYSSHLNLVGNQSNLARMRSVEVTDPDLVAALAVAAVGDPDAPLVGVIGAAGQDVSRTWARRIVHARWQNVQTELGVENPETGRPYNAEAFRQAAVVDRLASTGGNIPDAMAWSGAATYVSFHDRFAEYIVEPSEAHMIELADALLFGAAGASA